MNFIFRIGLIMSVGLFVGCSRTTTVNEQAPFLSGRAVTELKNKKLDEISGMEASTTNPGLFWVHNDSGAKAELFLVDSMLSIKLTLTLEGIKNRDWEDITLGPGPEENKYYLYVGDIGDNKGKHPVKKIYRFEEPRLSGTETLTIGHVDTILVKLPGKPKDSETLIIDPLTKDLFFFSKREEPVSVYRVPYPQAIGKITEAEEMSRLPLTQLTAGDVSDDGQEIILKNYRFVYYWKRQNGETVDQALQREPTLLSYVQEAQGEAMTWATGSNGFYTLGESNVLDKTYLLYYERKR